MVASGGAPDGVTVRGKSGPLKQFDWEGGQFPHLYELPVAFPPSYPYKESTDVACAAEFNCTRAPAWCKFRFPVFSSTVFSTVRAGKQTVATDCVLLVNLFSARGCIACGACAGIFY